MFVHIIQYTYLLFGIPVGFAQAVPNTVVLNKIIAAIYIFLYQDIQYRTNGITVHCSLSRLEPMQQYVMYSVLGWSGLTLFCDFNNLRCTHFCRSGIFY